jgi:hypothetical protein
MGSKYREMSRRHFLKAAGAGLGVAAIGGLLSACGANGADAAPPPLGKEPPSYALPTAEGVWTPPTGAHVGRMPTGTGRPLRVDGVGEFRYEAGEVKTLRPDIFQPGHFSAFDVLAHLAERGDFDLEYHFDESMDTHVVDSISGQGGWWYQALYSGGWYESNVFRMDMYPYKDGTHIRMYQEEREGRVADIYRTFREEVTRLEQNGGQVVIPEVTIQNPVQRERIFQDVAVSVHHVRTDVLQPGVVTALDILMSLAERGELSRLKLTWYERVGSADPVDNYWVEQIDEDEAYTSCGFVYEAGPQEFSGFRGSHIHISSDVRPIVSPEYALWYWICL